MAAHIISTEVECSIEWREKIQSLAYGQTVVEVQVSKHIAKVVIAKLRLANEISAR